MLWIEWWRASLPADLKPGGQGRPPPLDPACTCGTALHSIQRLGVKPLHLSLRRNLRGRHFRFTSASFMHDNAIATLDRNWRSGYTLPSPNLYPFQWNWDSGFIALGLAYHRPERAMEEIRSMFKGQWRTGMLPHINFHRPDPNYFPGPDVWGTESVRMRSPEVLTSGITQPPVFAFIIERISTLPFGRTSAWRDFTREIFPKIVAVHRYLYTHRDPQREGLVYIQHNWEAGTDNSPVYDQILDAIDVTHARDVSALRRDLSSVDAAHRPTDENYRRYIYLVDLFNACGYRDEEISARSPFLVQDVLFNALLVRSNRALITLARQLGEDASEIEQWNAKTTAAINRKLWDAERGFYFPYDLKSERLIPIKTSSGLMPLFAQVCNAEQRRRLADHLTTSFAPDNRWKLCPSTAVDETAFDAMKYWRGPVWVNLNLSGSNSPKLASAWLGRSVGGWRVDSSTRSTTYQC